MYRNCGDSNILLPRAVSLVERFFILCLYLRRSPIEVLLNNVIQLSDPTA